MSTGTSLGMHESNELMSHVDLASYVWSRVGWALAAPPPRTRRKGEILRGRGHNKKLHTVRWAGKN